MIEMQPVHATFLSCMNLTPLYLSLLAHMTPVASGRTLEEYYRLLGDKKFHARSLKRILLVDTVG